MLARLHPVDDAEAAVIPSSSAAPFSRWHRVHGQAVHVFKFPQWVPWWEAYDFGWVRWFPWARSESPRHAEHDAGCWTEMQQRRTEKDAARERVLTLSALDPTI